MSKLIKFIRKLFHLSQPYKKDELIAKWIDYKKPKGSDKE